MPGGVRGGGAECVDLAWAGAIAYPEAMIMRAIVLEFVAFLVVFAVGCNGGDDRKTPPPPPCPGGPLNFTPEPPGQGAREGRLYSRCIPASGGVPPYAWTIVSGTLPAGLTLDPSTGCITGTPATCSAGLYPLAVQVTDSCTSPGPQTDTLQTSIYIGSSLFSPPPWFGQFSDEFSGNMGQWVTCSTSGGPVPSIDTTFGNPAPSLDVGGSSGDNGEAVSLASFDIADHLSIVADIYIPALGGNSVDAWIGLKNVPCDGEIPGADSGAFIMFSGATSTRTFGLNGAVVFSDTALTPGWHSVDIRICRTSLIVIYSVDGDVIYRSATPISTQYNFSNITVGGRSAGGAVRIDNVWEW